MINLNENMIREIYSNWLEIINNLAKQVDKIIVPEMNLGQIYHPIKEAACGLCEVVCAPKTGGEMHLPQELLSYLGVK